MGDEQLNYTDDLVPVLSPERQLLIALERFVTSRNGQLDVTGDLTIPLLGGNDLIIPVELLQDAE